MHRPAPPAPVQFLNVPASHATQVVPSAPMCPTTQLQSVTPSLPADEKEFAGHVAHVAKPPSEKVPAAHCEQAKAPGLAEKVPGAHGAHAPRDQAPPVLEKVPAGHSIHAPATVPYFPPRHALQLTAPAVACRGAEHAEHASAPALLLKVPDAQATHSPPCACVPAWHSHHAGTTAERASPISPLPSPTLSVCPSPSHPFSFFPQHFTSRLSRSAHV